MDELCRRQKIALIPKITIRDARMLRHRFSQRTFPHTVRANDRNRKRLYKRPIPEVAACPDLTVYNMARRLSGRLRPKMAENRSSEGLQRVDILARQRFP